MKRSWLVAEHLSLDHELSFPEKVPVTFGGEPGHQADQNHRSGIEEDHAKDNQKNKKNKDDEQSQTLSETQLSEY